MAPANNQESTKADLEFFALITASVTHELNNIVSTIEQVAGLLEDHLAVVSANNRPVDPERVQVINERIAGQLQRATDTIDHLNMFAHSADEVCCRFELTNLLANLVTLSARLANLQKVKLEYETPAAESWIDNNPFLLQQAIFYCLKVSWGVAQQGDGITISLRTEDQYVCIVIDGPDLENHDGMDEPHACLAGMMASLAGTVDVVRQEKRRIFRLAIPVLKQ